MPATNEEIEDWLRNGQLGLLDFFDEENACFWRDSLREEGAGAGLTEAVTSPFPAATGATSSNRAFLASVELLFYLGEERHTGRREWTAVHARTAGVIRDMVKSYLSADLDSLRGHSQNGSNMFTDAHILQSLAVGASPFVTAAFFNGATQQRLVESGSAMAGAVVHDLSEFGGGRIHELQENSEIVTLYALRAIESARFVGTFGSSTVLPPELIPELRFAARADVLRQLGLAASRDPEFDPGALLAGIAILHRFAYRSARRLVLSGLEVLVKCQEPDGSWRADVLTLGRRRLVYVSSVEMASLLASLALADLARGSTKIAGLVEHTLDNSFALLESGFSDSSRLRHADPGGRLFRGWANDRTKQLGVVESWSTAIAIQFLLRLQRCRQALEQTQILTNLRVRAPRPPARPWEEPFRWVDLAGPVGRWETTLPAAATDDQIAALTPALDRVSDPSTNGRIRTGIRRDLVAPVIGSPFGQPQGFASFLLYGPPGSRKTSLVRAVATALRWPLLTLSPPDFLVDGIDGLEARAGAIFHDLMRLRRVVVLFDECEEFFRRRLPIDTPEHRTQGAFITAGMLPRLQDLRDREWVVFAIVTNTELDELDPAVVRRGRLDKKQRIGFPELGAQIDYIEARMRDRFGPISPDDQAVLRRGLERYNLRLDTDTEWLGVTRTSLRQDRAEAVEKRKRTGRLKHYFDQVSELRAIEAELPLVTFDALDHFAATLDQDDLPLSEPAVIDRLADVCMGRDPDAWADVP